MSINRSWCYSAHCVPLFYICGYYYVQATVLLKLKNLISSSYIQMFWAHFLYGHTYILCSYGNDLNGDLKSITFVMLAVHKPVALISSS